MKFATVGKVLFLLAGCSLFASFGSGCEVGSKAIEGISAAEEKRPVYLYKILSTDDWEKSRDKVLLSSADAPFIHLATEEQLGKIIEKYWSDVPEYVVLKVETEQLSGRLVLEANPGGTSKYYHLYDGAIPLSAIVESRKQEAL